MYIRLSTGSKNAAVLPEPERRTQEDIKYTTFIHNIAKVTLKWCLTCLCTRHQVSFGFDDRDGIFLDWSGARVAGQTDVSHDNLTHIYVMELHHKSHVKIHIFHRWCIQHEPLDRFSSIDG